MIQRYICEKCGAVRIFTRNSTSKVVECLECEGHSYLEGYNPPKVIDFNPYRNFKENEENEKEIIGRSDEEL